MESAPPLAPVSPPVPRNPPRKSSPNTCPSKQTAKSAEPQTRDGQSPKDHQKPGPAVHSPRATKTPKIRPPAPQLARRPERPPLPSKDDLAESAHSTVDRAKGTQGGPPLQQGGQPAGPAQPPATTRGHQTHPHPRRHTTPTPTFGPLSKHTTQRHHRLGCLHPPSLAPCHAPSQPYPPTHENRRPPVYRRLPAQSRAPGHTPAQGPATRPPEPQPRGGTPPEPQAPRAHPGPASARPSNRNHF
ncbi:basic salivary proline-rich protein 1-like [Austrofundulus limnaeus]|uniref:Basic salivary proline-rich protein 1-like n=1 Tax=Austrofundulus limnaeus TaxID=52670 RepID=A0A2I4B3I6_AUSLI|nr:PREDICTED: basic salivary proline-rich protein 1-like [Austrofundulus limnaeus]